MLSWVAGLYWSDIEADWAWLWRADTNGDSIPDTIVVPPWGNPDDDPHTTESLGIYGEATWAIGERFRLIGGLRFNNTDKGFTRSGGPPITEWDDSALLHKAVVEWDVTDDMMLYLSSATGIRTGGANDGRVTSRGAPAEYENEEVHSIELGLKSTLLDGRMTLNAVAFINDYEDVKAQLFAVACNPPVGNFMDAAGAPMTVVDCANRRGQTVDVPDGMGGTDAVEISTTTFEYYENGGGSETIGLEFDLRWQATEALLITGTLAFLDAEFDDDFRVGNAALRPLLGLGNIGGRQDINAAADEDQSFSFAGWTPALTPDYQLGLGASYEFVLGGGATLTPSLNASFVGDYYAFDTNIPETLVNAHETWDLRVTWVSSEGNIEIGGFVLNLTDEEVITRAVVHSQIVGGQPANSVQVNWNNPLTWGLSAKYRF